MIDPKTFASLGVIGVLAFLLVYFLMNPEKVEIWSGLIGKGFPA